MLRQEPTTSTTCNHIRGLRDYSEFSVYDLGQAVAHMSVQAQSLSLHVRQFRAFDRAGLAAEFEVPPHWEVTTMSAIGHIPSSAPHDPRDGSRPARQRRPSARECQGDGVTDLGLWTRRAQPGGKEPR